MRQNSSHKHTQPTVGSFTVLDSEETGRGDEKKRGGREKRGRESNRKTERWEKTVTEESGKRKRDVRGL